MRCATNLSIVNTAIKSKDERESSRIAPLFSLSFNVKIEP
jgi:hypothetical protein